MSLFGRKNTKDPEPDTRTAVGPRNTAIDDDFVPATTWDGLEWIGTRTWEKKRNVLHGHKFERYGGNKRPTDLNAIKNCVKEALVSAIEARNLELGKVQDQKPTIKNIKQLEGSWATGWTVGEPKLDWKLDLEDLEFRFAVVKKLAAVSGIHLTDPAIMRISDAYDLLHEAKVLPKQQKLVERKGKELVVAGSKKTAKSELDLSLLDLPNVKVRSKRIRKEDREKEIGRWKVTGEELRARRLL